MKGLACVAMTCALLSGLGSAFAADKDRCSRSSMDIDTLPDGRILVPVTVDGRPLRFLLDTGGVVTTIKWEIAKELGLPVKQSEQRFAGVGGSLLNFYVAEKSLSVGGKPVKARPMLLETRNLAGADGTLSSDVLREYDVEIDLANRSVSLISSNYCEVIGAAVISMTVGRNGHVHFPAKVDGNPIAATIDTGSTTSLLGMRSAALLGVAANSPGLIPIGTDRGYPIYTYPFRLLEFGAMSVNNPLIAIADDSFMPAGEPDLVLGIDALRGLRITVAYGQNRLYLVNNKLGSDQTGPPR